MPVRALRPANDTPLSHVLTMEKTKMPLGALRRLLQSLVPHRATNDGENTNARQGIATCNTPTRFATCS